MIKRLRIESKLGSMVCGDWGSWLKTLLEGEEAKVAVKK
jgi:hypothetical protein